MYWLLTSTPLVSCMSSYIMITHSSCSNETCSLIPTGHSGVEILAQAREFCVEEMHQLLYQMEVYLNDHGV
jgi:hypothetical protein